MSATVTGREVRLVARPHGAPVPDDFALATVEVPAPGPGEILVRNVFMSVDPYMRGRMNDAKSYAAPFALGAVMDGGAVGEVVASESPRFAVGDEVIHNAGWRDYAVVPADAARAVDGGAAPLSRYLGILGMPGLTAWVGLMDIAAFRPDDIVFVSGAAGAVGSAVGQMAHLLGSPLVVGSAGTDEKVAVLTGELGFHAAFNYRSGPVAAQLRAAAPDGIDVYFDNVGGAHLEAAIASMRDFGRIAACGAISVYNATEPPPGPRNMTMIVGKRLTLRGFIVSDHASEQVAFVDQVGGWLRNGSIKAPETIVDGLDHAVDAFIGMLHGTNTGKTVVRVGAS
jgi:NADPH-dependent curcumin reductase CurA